MTAELEASRHTVIAAAEQWHLDHLNDLDHDYSSCWCCCITCEHTNPHFDAAADEQG